MTTPPDEQKPLGVCDALEEEFEALHGRLPDDYPRGRPEAERVLAMRRAIHALEPGRSALCLSGGGIRSATFGLGVLQALAAKGVLGRFDYLSTVSGGGYIGGWLSAWMARERQREGEQGAARVLTALAASSRTLVDPEPRSIRWLRSYSNYLSPRAGLFSADSWTLFATFLRNVLLNWLVLVPLLGLVLIVPRLFDAALDAPPAGHVLVHASGALLAVIGLTYMILDLPSTGARKWPADWFLVGCLVPITLAAALLSLGWAWRAAETDLEALRNVLIVGGVLLHAVPVLIGRVLSWLIRGRPDPSKQYASMWHWVQIQFFDWTAIAASGALGGWLVWLAASWVVALPASAPDLYVTIAAPLLIAVFLLAATAYVGLASRVTGEDDREWWARAGAWFLFTATGWIALCAIVLLAPGFLAWLGSFGGWVVGALGSAGGLSGLAAAYAGYRSSRPRPGQEEARRPSVLKALVEGWGLRAGALLFVATLLLLLSEGNRALIGLVASFSIVPGAQAATWIVAIGLLAVVLICAWYVGINKFSLHAMYGNRLVRAYLGASNADRSPHLFTGFDSGDNVRMKDLAGQRPFHVVNIALNIVRGERLAWQQRKAKSFTVSPLHAGSFTGACGYRPSADYSGEGTGISLGKAMTISGAAASPNMGYHSSPLITFLMTIFNARLGWWLGNPGKGGRHTWTQGEPRFALRPLLAEALGWTTDDNPYVYLSDGGHFENLGLYEMVLRRCHDIIVVDAGCDPEFKFEDLANAIHKIRADFGIPIVFEADQRPTRDVLTRQGFAIGTIQYSVVDPTSRDGTLVYLKPVLRNREPVDVARYAAEHTTPITDCFPHQSTNDQWFDESQFESYRMLGYQLARELGGERAVSVAELVARIRTSAGPPKAAPPAASAAAGS